MTRSRESLSMAARPFASRAEFDVSLRLVIGLAFAMILLVSTGGLVWFNAQVTSRMQKARIDQQFETLVSDVRSEIKAQFDSADVVLDTLSIGSDPPSDPEEAGDILVRVLANLEETSPAVSAVYFGRGDGSYVLARKLDGKELRRARAAKAEGAAFEIQIGWFAGQISYDRFVFVDAAYRKIARAAAAQVDYDPRRRPWYVMAMATDDAVVTPPYRFHDVDGFGVTMSRRADKTPTTVFSIDITLAGVSEMLRRALVFPQEHIAIFEPNGALIGESSGQVPHGNLKSPSPLNRKALRSPAFRLAASAFRAFEHDQTSRSLTLIVAGQKIYTNIARLVIGNTDFVLASTLPAEVVDAPARRSILRLLTTQIGIVIVAFLLVSYAAKSISGPIHALSSEVERIVSFYFADQPRSKSRIREIRRLGGAVETLELTLRSFSMFLPPAFVRAIVDRRQAPALGGRRQPVTVLFTDVAGFTAIAETLTPDQLMQQMSRYFGEISDEIFASGGMIDKFIGDSVMALWNAPVEQSDHVARACRAVLRASERIDALNLQLLAEGLPAMPTRFGLHTGDAMVGSVGAAGRMNYTAVGHTINVASRLEALNKVYGTKILVSAAVCQQAGEGFYFRPVDSVVVRGTQESIEIYEMAGRHPVGSALQAELGRGVGGDDAAGARGVAG